MSAKVTVQRNFDLCVPRKETAWPQSQFPHSCVCERSIYSHDRFTTCFPAAEYAHKNMIVGIGTVAAHFLFWENMF